ncbi:MAG: hypothetical protein FWG40_10290 [Peptococcaceae bacterium]|nr:hypothetical protein [Peptococcaceae bacterium]
MEMIWKWKVRNGLYGSVVRYYKFNNVLEEYVLAIAAERIAKIDLKDDAFLWSTAKEWVPLWDQHLKVIKNNVEEITSSAIDEKALSYFPS